MKGGKTSGEPSGAGKIVDAARTLVAIERDMQEEAMDFHGHLSRFFSPAERRRIIAHLAVKGVTFSIHNACKVVAGECHTTLMPWLYSWCNDHKHKIREAVERAKSVSR